MPVADPSFSRLRVRPALTAVTEVVALAKGLLPPMSVWIDDELDSLPSASRALRMVWRRVEEVLRYGALDETHVSPGRDLAFLLLSLRRADEIIRKAELDRLALRVSAVGDALAGLDGIGSVEQLWNACPRAVSQLGFDRGMVSLVVDMVWTPKSAHSDREAAWTQQLVESGKRSPRNINSSLPEFDLVRSHKAILVTDVQQRPDIYEEVVRTSRSRSYVAARIVANGNLVGFIHGDRYFSRESVDDIDRSLLGVFGEAFGHVLSRALVIERSTAVQSRLSSIAAGIGEAVTGLNWSQDEVVYPIPGAPGDRMDDLGAAELPLSDCGLTGREMEVLKMMATGVDNAEIARDLFIANETVKSHVKHVLRKLGATSRAEAVARWFNDASRR
ncbi:MAG: modulated transcriptional regulator, LuxR family [Frankiales bacterium]|jgi:DNA-binding CsgD family transcriptional regulator|nr:modulated transcriptional regulator, LuxR family [Frankiales bacterium]